MEQTPERDMQQRYKNVFGTIEGKKVLGDILSVGHVFDVIVPTEVDRVAERNFAIVIASMAGAFDMLYTQLGMDKEN